MKKPKTIAGFPSPFVSKEIKEEEGYFLAYCRAVQGNYIVGTTGYFQNRRRKIMNNRAYASGNQNTAKYSNWLTDANSTTAFNFNYEQIGILPSLVRRIVNKITETLYDVRVRATDPLAISMKLGKEYELVRQRIMSSVSLLLGQMTPEEAQALPQSMMEFQMGSELNAKLSFEKAIEEAILVTFKLNKFDREIIRKIVKDLFVCGIAATRTYLDSAKGIINEYIDPVNLVTSIVDGSDHANLDFAAELKYMRIIDIKRMTGKKFDESQWRKIAQKVKGNFGNNNYYYTEPLESNYYTDQYVYEYDGFRVPVMKLSFASIDRKKIVKKENRRGETRYYEKPYSYDGSKNRKIKEEHIDEHETIYSGYWIQDTDMVFNYKMEENLIKDNDTLEIVKFPYTIYAPNIEEMEIKSDIEGIIPHVDQIQLIYLRIQELSAVTTPNDVEINFDAIESISLGNGGELSELDIVQQGKRTGTWYMRYKNVDDDRYNGQAVRYLNSNQPAKMAQHINTLSFHINQIYQDLGINPQSEGQQIDPESKLGQLKIQQASTNTALFHLRHGMKFFLEECATKSALLIQDLKYYPFLHNFYKEAIGFYDVDILSMLNEMSMHSIGVFVELDLDAEQRLLLEQNLQAAVARGEIRPEDAAFARRLKNETQIYQFLNRQAEIRRQQALKEKNQAIVLQGQVNERAALTAAQMEQTNTQEKTRLKLLEIEAQKQADIELQRVKSAGDYRIELIKQNEKNQKDQVDKEFQMQKEKYKEDRKDERTEIEATQQSELIEQRKNNLPPKDFEKEQWEEITQNIS